MPMNFSGRVAIVTGAGGGLGRQHALALALAARGAKVVVNDLTPEAPGAQSASVAAAEISAAGGTTIASQASVTDEAAVAAMVQQALEAWGRVDILVNNAGRVVMTTSSSGLWGNFGQANYGAAKTALVGLISDRSEDTMPDDGSAQGRNEIRKAMAAAR